MISVGDRRVEIETGYGLESRLPDAKVGDIIDTEITPRFKQGDFDHGTLAGAQAMVMILQRNGSPLDAQIPSSEAQPDSMGALSEETISQPHVAIPQTQQSQSNSWLIWVVSGGALLAIAGVVANSQSVRTTWLAEAVECGTRWVCDRGNRNYGEII